MSSVLATYTDASSYRCPSGPASSASSPLVSVRTSAPHAENSNTSCAYISQPLTLSVYTQCKTWKQGFTDLCLGSTPQITIQPPSPPPPPPSLSSWNWWTRWKLSLYKLIRWFQLQANTKVLWGCSVGDMALYCGNLDLLLFLLLQISSSMLIIIMSIHTGWKVGFTFRLWWALTLL